MNFIMIILKINMVTTQDCYSRTDSLMYVIKTEDVYEDFSKDKKSLILVIFQLSQSFMIIQTN